MARLLLSLILAIFLLIFASQNMHEIEVSLIFGKEIELPLILVIATSFLCGFAVAVFNFIVRKSGNRNNSHHHMPDDY
ncbi:MAG: DUF1049 domain-containing protein [Magnetococcales bacterium]|nr:DUF1049 domain-containing protein [Magnetococcales bacterium]